VDWYETYNIEPRTDALDDGMMDGGSTESLLAEYEIVLSEYLESLADDNQAFASAGDLGEYFDELGGGMPHGKDSAYEADLHLSIGALYLSRSSHGSGDSSIQSASHLEQALRLYELSGESQTENMATTKYNLSIYHLRNGDYQQSATFYAEALDIFQTFATDEASDFNFGAAANVKQSLHSLLSPTQHRKPQSRTPPTIDNAKSQSSSDKRASSSSTSTKPSLVQAISIDDEHDGRQKRPVILVDMQQFLQQNDSSKDEL
jgi:tetratricopeptide (TPR) repeat protein